MEKHLGFTQSAIQMLISAELPFTILTKSSLIDRDFLLFKSYPKFRAGFSFTTIDPIEAREWEPGCGYVRDRAAVLQKFKSHGIKTWVSLEPVMSVESTIRVIRELNKWVDFFWVGALQHMQPPTPINLIEAHRQIMEVLEYYHSNYRFKRSFTDA
jgi:DNA repair photolyase